MSLSGLGLGLLSSPTRSPSSTAPRTRTQATPIRTLPASPHPSSHSHSRSLSQSQSQSQSHPSTPSTTRSSPSSNHNPLNPFSTARSHPTSATTTSPLTNTNANSDTNTYTNTITIPTPNTNQAQYITPPVPALVYSESSAYDYEVYCAQPADDFSERNDEERVDGVDVTDMGGDVDGEDHDEDGGAQRRKDGSGRTMGGRGNNVIDSAAVMREYEAHYRGVVEPGRVGAGNGAGVTNGAGNVGVGIGAAGPGIIPERHEDSSPSDDEDDENDLAEHEERSPQFRIVQVKVYDTPTSRSPNSNSKSPNSKSPNPKPNSNSAKSNSAKSNSTKSNSAKLNRKPVPVSDFNADTKIASMEGIGPAIGLGLGLKRAPTLASVNPFYPLPSGMTEKTLAPSPSPLSTNMDVDAELGFGMGKSMGISVINGGGGDGMGRMERGVDRVVSSNSGAGRIGGIGSGGMGLGGMGSGGMGGKNGSGTKERGTMDNKPMWMKVTLVLVCTMGMVINIASTTAVTISLPVIGRAFDVQQDQLQWLVSGFALSSGCLLILFGRLADLYGKKRAFLLGVAWLGIFSIACGAVNNVLTLDVLRGIQGVGPAAYIPASIGILAQAFPPSRARAIAFSTFSAGAPIGGAVGQQLGGILVQYTKATWRAPFFLMAALAAITFAGGWVVIENDHVRLTGQTPNGEEEDRRVDWLGAFLVSAGLVLVTFVLGQGQLAPMQWSTPYIIVLLILGIALLFAFGFWQHYLEKNAGKMNVRPPLMKLSLWKRANGKFAAVQMIAFLEWASYISWGFWALLYYQDFLNISPVLSAVRLLPTAIVGLAANAIVALVIGRIDMLYLVVFGTIMTGLAGLLFAVINPATTYWAFGFPAACFSVFGVDFVFASGTLFVAKVSLPSEQSLSGGLFQTLTQLGTAVGLAITTIINDRVLQDQSRLLGVNLLPNQSNAPRDAQLKAYQAAQWGVFAFAAVGTILAIVFLRGIGIVGEQKQKPGSMSNPLPDSHSDTTVVTVPQTPAKGTIGIEQEKSFNNKIAMTVPSSTDGRQIMQTIQIQSYIDANGNQRWSIVR